MGAVLSFFFPESDPAPIEQLLEEKEDKVTEELTEAREETEPANTEEEDVGVQDLVNYLITSKVLPPLIGNKHKIYISKNSAFDFLPNVPIMKNEKDELAHFCWLINIYKENLSFYFQATEKEFEVLENASELPDTETEESFEVVQ